MLAEALPAKEADLRQAADRHASALEEAHQPQGRVWGFWDFVYFSGVTITTVGYGDILPNRTLVRMLVLVEILIGLVLFGFGVTMLSSAAAAKRT
jgi:hypothetical protein